jgi:hypothetical protein
LYHHWQIVLGDDDCAATTVILDAGSAFLDHIFKMNARGRIKESLGEGTFIYEGVQATDYPQFTLWRFSMYGVQFGDADKPEEKPSIIFSTTGPRSLLPTFWKTALGEVLVPA